MLSQDEMLHNSPNAAQLKALGSRDKRNWSAFLARSGYCWPLSDE
jgi:hypothetical protein